MKKLLIVLIVFSFACNKNGGKTCWDCEVTRLDGSTYYQKVCNDGSYPKFKDRLGNDLRHFVQRDKWQKAKDLRKTLTFRFHTNYKFFKTW